jgi:spore coat protein U-like protein
MKKFLLLTAIACAATLSAVAPAMADDAATTTSTDLLVTASVTKSCSKPTVDTPSTISGYNGLDDVSDNSTITFRCTKGTKGTVKLTSVSTSKPDGGKLSADGTTDQLTYTLTGDGEFRTGNGLTPTIATNNLTTPARVTVAKGQDVTAGKIYTDTIKITISH